jgi:hypothetical protein
MDYAALASRAGALLAKYGQGMVLARTTKGARDISTGTPAAGSTETWTGSGIEIEFDNRSIDGTMVKVGDKRILLSAPSVAQPKSGDTLTYAGETWRVEQAKIIKPGTVAVLYDVQVRK